MIRKIFHFFDRLEDKVRSRLSHAPLMYALIGGTGVVLFWRGVWHMADDINMNSIISTIIGIIIMLITGVFVSSFIGSRIIMSGLLGEKKIAEKTGDEIRTEESQIKNIQETLNKVEEELTQIENKIENK
jgi:uncharacterized protein YneF (UPF0154 family)